MFVDAKSGEYCGRGPICFELWQYDSELKVLSENAHYYDANQRVVYKFGTSRQKSTHKIFHLETVV